MVSFPAKSLACAALLALLTLATTNGCTAKRVLPEVPLGWHNTNYSVIFGYLQKLPPKTEDSDPVWVIRYAGANDLYGGELALTPPQKLLGYSGGERVQLRGAVREDLGHPDYPGKWFEVQGAQLWDGRR